MNELQLQLEKIKRSQQKLSESLAHERRLRQAFMDALPCVVLLLRYPSREIVAANKAANEVGVVAGATCFSSWCGRNDACPWCRAPEALDSRTSQHLQFWNLDTCWDSYWVPIDDGLYLHYAFDITESQTDKAALQIANDELENRVSRLTREREQALNRLDDSKRLAAVIRVSTAIAREFNDPLQTVTNVLGGIRRRSGLEPGDLPLVDLAYGEIRRLSRLVGEFQEFYQPTRGKTDFFEIGSELTALIETSRTQLAEKGIKIATKFAENVPPFHADAEQLRTMFKNLLDNAIEACSDSDTIMISTSVDNDVLTIDFTDDGCGIAPEIAAQLFEPFTTSKTAGFGKGLGLAVAYAIAIRHGGTIEAETSETDKTIFKITLPLDPVLPTN